MNSALRTFRKHLAAGRKLQIVLLLKLVAITAYAVMNTILVMFLSVELNFDDKQAGLVIATWSALLSLFTVIVGSLVDNVGVRVALLSGFGICLFARGFLTIADNQFIAVALGIFPLAIGEALLTPVMVAAVNQYADGQQRAMAFSMFYTLMNVGFAVAGYVVDEFRSLFGESGQIHFPYGVFSTSTYRCLFTVSWLLTALGGIITLIGVEPRASNSIDERRKKAKQAPKRGMFVKRSVILLLSETSRTFKSCIILPGFYRFILLLSVMVGVRMVLYHMYYTFPKFALRELGEGAPVGRLFSVLNAGIVIIFTPLLGVFTQKMSTYAMLVVGTLITVAGVSLLSMPVAWFADLSASTFGKAVVTSWLGIRDVENPLYLVIMLAVVLYSIGESVWSPRLYEYTATIAPKCQEATYMSMSFLPLFVAKVMAGAMSGYLLERYCPVAGPRDSPSLWLWITGFAAITPLGLFVLRAWICPPGIRNIRSHN